MPTSRPSRAASALSRSRAASLLRELPSRLPGRLADDAGSARLIGELRTALPALPRALGPRDLVSAIEQILQRAARHELEREGLDLVEALVDLPDGWTRRDLLAAEIPAIPSFQAFALTAAAAVRVREVPTTGAAARTAATSPGAADAYGITLEAAGDLVSFLLSRGRELFGTELEAALVPGVTEATGTEGTADDAVFFDRAQSRARAIVREALERAVTVPQELRVAQSRRSEVRAAAEGLEALGVEADLLGGVGVDEEDGIGAQERAGESAGAAPRSDAETPKADADPTAGAQDRPRPRFAERASAAAEQSAAFAQQVSALASFLQTDAGRAALKIAKDGGAVARDLYVKGQGRKDGAAGPGTD